MNNTSHTKRLLILTSFLAAASAATLSAQTELMDPEKFVQSQLNLTGQADFSKSGLKNHTIRHQFLENLITNPKPSDVVAMKGMLIRGAVISGRLSIGSATVPFPLSFYDCIFKDGFDLSSNVFSRDFLLIHSQVGSPLADTPTFEADKFSGKVSLDQTTFYNGVDFTGAEIGGPLESDDVSYESEEDEADFTDIKISKRASFQHAHFRGGLDLTGADIADLVIDGGMPTDSAPAGHQKGTNLLLGRTRISKGLVVQNLVLSGFAAGSAKVQGQASFTNVLPLGRMYFNESHFEALRINGLDPWLLDARNFTLQGMSYASIDLPDSNTTPAENEWLDLIDESSYTPQPYLELEKFLRSRGGYDYADEVYFRMRRHGRKQLSWSARFLDWAEEKIVGYGREIWKAALYSALWILVGTFVFWRRDIDVVHDNEESTDNWYNPFWYSLDLLSPVDLGISKKWRPTASWRRHYAQVHRIAGWVLIPLIAAAITGIIK